MNMPRENKLAGEKSPHLLLHARNPVEWYPWGKEAFELAQEEDKPIFLSIGYASCHWCHVMEKECFNDEEVAELLNDVCVSIKVDREERPDLDALFMEICQIQNGNDGWPLNLFLTPTGEPFFAATFLPKRTIGRMPGLADIIPRVKWLWLTQKEDVLQGAKDLADTLISRFPIIPGGPISILQARMVLKELRNSFDGIWGGFGFAPKFPCAPKLLFLLRFARSLRRSAAYEEEEIFSMVDLTLRKMWAGGIHDHIGGGYARYTTDERWTVPHFEKMLYDQAMLLWVAAAAQEMKPDAFYLKFAEDIVSCVTRDFLSPEACFWASLDADSEGEEGKYYIWTEDEIRVSLPQGDSGLFCAAYAVMPSGNFTNETTGRQTGYNVLYEAIPYMEVARRYGIRPPELVKRLENDRKFLLKAREKRPKPLVDNKILMDWNGLIIGALAYAGRIFEKKEWTLSAERAALFLQKVLVDPKGSWRRRYCAKEAAIPALPGDYAALMWGVMELYESATMSKQKRDWLKYAENLSLKLEERFWDEERGGFFLSAADEEYIFYRRKSAVDSAVPSANALAMMAYAALTGADPDNPKYPDRVKRVGSCFSRAALLRPTEHLSIITAFLEFTHVLELARIARIKEESAIADEEIEDQK
jgi:uncharacterized protein YyaL (SSP411 family)